MSCSSWAPSAASNGYTQAIRRNLVDSLAYEGNGLLSLSCTQCPTLVILRSLWGGGSIFSKEGEPESLAMWLRPSGDGPPQAPTNPPHLSQWRQQECRMLRHGHTGTGGGSRCATRNRRGTDGAAAVLHGAAEGQTGTGGCGRCTTRSHRATLYESLGNTNQPPNTDGLQLLHVAN